ncbi:mechanosensitive ion channel family protein [Vibrio owensii]|uniref:mechanosensitive ion channel family protein n=1 Tax=Vibrio owensii TaxID=696485 RepID=UPI001269C5A7|nr:mechanosensitive ion channel family protein [Vibrio owensii]
MSLSVTLTSAVASEVSTVPYTQIQKTTPSSLELEIDQNVALIDELTLSFESATGDVKDAIQVQLFKKNDELRDKLDTAVNKKLVPAGKLVELIETQQIYTEESFLYVLEKVQLLNQQFKDSGVEEKLSILSDYRELQKYLDSAFQSSYQNIIWLKSLGEIDVKAHDKLKRDTKRRLQLLSASVDYWRQQKDIVSTQTSNSPDGEKVTLQLSLLYIQQRIDVATDSLKAISKIADDLEIETSDYKRQIFEVTGNFTHELLDTRVALSIASNWSGKLFNWLSANAIQYIFQVFIFFLILFSAKALAKFGQTLVRSTLTSHNLNMTKLMQDFFVSMTGKFVWFIAIMFGLSQLGFDIAPVLTGFGIAGVIVGFALQDTLSNFAAGMMLLIYRPFDVGDFVHAGGVDGKVSHMSLVNTTIRTFDNQIIIVPNGKIWGEVIKNVTHERVRRVDMVFCIGYSDDLIKAEQVLSEIIKTHDLVLENPEPIIKVHALNTSSVDLIVRPWVRTDDYWNVYWDITKSVKLRFDEVGITIPFPQQDVHLHYPVAQSNSRDIN